MNSDAEYKKIKSFFIILFSITSVCITALAIVSYKDYTSLKNDYKERLEKTESQINELIANSEKVIERTETRGVKEIENIKYSVNSIARQEAIDRINETFKYGNIKDLVESAAEKSINEELDKIIKSRIKQTETEINGLIDASLSLMTSMNLMTMGDPSGLESLRTIIKNEPFTPKGKLAKKILKIKSDDYRQYMEKMNGKNLEKYLDELEIKKEIRNNKEELVKVIVNSILQPEQSLHGITAGTIALELLGLGQFEVFNLEEIEKLK